MVWISSASAFPWTSTFSSFKFEATPLRHAIGVPPFFVPMVYASGCRHGSGHRRVRWRLRDTWRPGQTDVYHRFNQEKWWFDSMLVGCDCKHQKRECHGIWYYNERLGHISGACFLHMIPMKSDSENSNSMVISWDFDGKLWTLNDISWDFIGIDRDLMG